MSSTKPNIILILSDEHRGQAMAHNGDTNLQTPAMDRLAMGGCSFSRAYANCPICTPSRGTIFSGRHAHAGPVAAFFDAYKATAPSLATELRKQGYHTAYFGKWHCGIVRDQLPPNVRANPAAYGGVPVRTPERHRAGFEDWFGFENLNKHFASYTYRGHDVNPTFTPGYETDGLTDLAVDYLSHYDHDKPLLLVLSVTPPHFPLVVPDRWLTHDPATLSVPPNFTESPHMRECLARYYAMIENLDWNMGRLMDAVGSLSRFSDTLTVYTSDHGDFMGSHGRQSRKEHPHEESVRIPAILNWPGQIPARGGMDGLFSLVDLTPTLLGLAGADIPAYCQGFDWSAMLQGRCDDGGPESVLLEMTGNPRWTLDFLDWRGLVTRDWKYAFYETGEELLFDLKADPYEQHNLALEQPERCQAWRARLLKELAATREPFFDVVIEHGVQANPATLDVSNIPTPEEPPAQSR